MDTRHVKYWDLFYNPHATMGIVGEWISQDAWHRKDLGDGSYFIISRRADEMAVWTWRRTTYEGRLVASGIGLTLDGAKFNADSTVELIPVVLI